VPDSAGPRFLGIRPLGGFEAALIGRLSSGLPFTRYQRGTDSLVGAPHSERLPASSTFDMPLRRPLSLGGMRGSVYMDVRNLRCQRRTDSVVGALSSERSPA